MALKETEIVTNYRLNKNRGITEADNCFYVPLRVTGMGETIRFDDKTKSYYIEDRLKSEYIKYDVIEACSKLPITIGHPDNGDVINSSNINDVKIVGQTIDAWLEEDEIWSLGRIYDKSVIPRFSKDLKSTSPGVVSAIIGTHNGVSQEAPIEINHLALVEHGHWDQLSPEAIRLDEERRMKMAEEAKQVDSTIEETEQADSTIEETEQANSIIEEAKQADSTIEEAQTNKEDRMVEERQESLEQDTLPIVDKEAAITETIAEETESKNDDFLDSIVPKRADEASETEIVDEECEVKADAEREEVIKLLRTICDEADPSFNFKMPFISQRETPRSVIKKFVKENPIAVSSKHFDLLQNRIDSIPHSFVADFMSDLKQSLELYRKSSKASTADWQDSGNGYQVRKEW